MVTRKAAADVAMKMTAAADVARASSVPSKLPPGAESLAEQWYLHLSLPLPSNGQSSLRGLQRGNCFLQQQWQAPWYFYIKNHFKNCSKEMSLLFPPILHPNQMEPDNKQCKVLHRTVNNSNLTLGAYSVDSHWPVLHIM